MRRLFSKAPSRRYPIFEGEISNPRKGLIVGHQNGARGKRMGRDLHIKIAECHAASLQRGAQNSIAGSGLAVPR